MSAGVRVNVIDEEVDICVQVRIGGVVAWEVCFEFFYSFEGLISYFSSVSVTAFAQYVLE